VQRVHYFRGMLDWQTEVLPALVAAYELIDESTDGFIDGENVAAKLGRDADESSFYSLFRQLDDADYVNVQVWGGGMAPPAMIGPTEKGLQITRGWPGRGGESTEILLRLLDERIADPDVPEEERTRLERLRDAAGDVSKGVLQSVLGAWLTHVSGASGV
jgi:hypothetical protein